MSIFNKNTYGQDYDKTVVQFDYSNKQQEKLPFTAVAVAQKQSSASHSQYIPEQSSLDMFSAGINPLVQAATSILTNIIFVQKNTDISLESYRNVLISEIQAFNTKAKIAGFNDAQVNTAQYLLCTALDESITNSNIPAANESWQAHSLLSTFHKDTWGGELFFSVLDRAMKQPASRLYLLELMYILLSLGFEGKYRMQERGVLELESLRDQLYRQIRVLRGEPSSELARHIPMHHTKTKIHTYISAWFMLFVVTICLGITVFGFNMALENKIDPLLYNLSQSPENNNIPDNIKNIDSNNGVIQ